MFDVDRHRDHRAFLDGILFFGKLDFWLRHVRQTAGQTKTNRRPKLL
jgi:hypothetical protein